MALIREWLNDFLVRHRARYSPTDWPSTFGTEEGRAFLALWLRTFALNQVTEAEADAASESLACDPPNFVREHIPRIISAVKTLRGLDHPDGHANSLEAAQERLRALGGCFGPNPIVGPDGELLNDNGLGCGWTGFATRYHPRPDPERRIPATLVGYCACPVGRWMMESHKASDPDLLKKYLDLAKEQTQEVWWLCEPPSVRVDPTDSEEHTFVKGWMQRMLKSAREPRSA